MSDKTWWERVQNWFNSCPPYRCHCWHLQDVRLPREGCEKGYVDTERMEVCCRCGARFSPTGYGW